VIPQIREKFKTLPLTFFLLIMDAELKIVSAGENQKLNQEIESIGC
jgi:hypothetical protein